MLFKQHLHLYQVLLLAQMDKVMEEEIMFIKGVKYYKIIDKKQKQKVYHLQIIQMISKDILVELIQGILVEKIYQELVIKVVQEKQLIKLMPYQFIEVKILIEINQLMILLNLELVLLIMIILNLKLIFILEH